MAAQSLALSFKLLQFTLPAIILFFVHFAYGELHCQCANNKYATFSKTYIKRSWQEQIS